ncbi:MAG: 3'(2'),5'-bisphosphate nucleotidase [Balneola sp.]|jgi:3'(2'), 5'-bisphosphate nucleotidase|nr:3'(2'),5'-bisphosphate nucleotidase [Balneola sp.]MBE80479.1 3'(2'),5'-bisphosphate nucleotidase [Balneola sp.]HBX67032.1 3'(2'),5'-bisphosphate nucleotidase [Balneolaceae bacterium]|tara:strand:- start:3716 stop:4489 length:774 start_codon:yes stop_codon:yes gene_type:complete
MLNQVIKTAEKAGKKILEFYETDVEVITKEDDSPLTKADLAAHHIIVDALKEIDPGTPIISEESGLPSYEERKEWTKFWLVDPLDGTKEFIKKNGEFTVNIALIENQKPVMGVVYVPAFDVMYYAEKSIGSFKKENGKEAVKLNSPAFEAPGKARIVVSRSHGDDQTAKKLSKLGIEVSEEVPSGSSIKFCLVAEGKADLYPRLGPTMEWDTGAADAIYRYSIDGGEKFSPLVYNKESLKNPYFLLGTNTKTDLESL